MGARTPIPSIVMNAAEPGRKPPRRIRNNGEYFFGLCRNPSHYSVELRG